MSQLSPWATHLFCFSLMRTNCAGSLLPFFCTIYQRLSKCLLNPFPNTGFVDLHGGPGWAWSEADLSWCPSLTSTSSDLHKVTLTQLHLLLPLFSSTRLTLTSPSPLTQTHKALTKKKEKRGGGVALIKTTVWVPSLIHSPIERILSLPALIRQMIQRVGEGKFISGDLKDGSEGS